MQVVFRAFSEGDVIGLLCGTGKDCRPGNVLAYQHVGQYTEAPRALGRSLRLATPEEFKPLLNEMSALCGRPVTPVSRLRA